MTSKISERKKRNEQLGTEPSTTPYHLTATNFNVYNRRRLPGSKQSLIKQIDKGRIDQVMTFGISLKTDVEQDMRMSSRKPET